jgi:hypothetical protein
MGKSILDIFSKDFPFNEKAPSEWADIRRAEDTEPFRGHIVAYETNLRYFGMDRNNWRPDGAGPYFGHVAALDMFWNNASEAGPKLATLVKPGGVHLYRALISDRLDPPWHEHLDGGPLFRMRLAKKEETDTICRAVTGGLACIEYGDDGFRRGLETADLRMLYASKPASRA